MAAVGEVIACHRQVRWRIFAVAAAALGAGASAAATPPNSPARAATPDAAHAASTPSDRSSAMSPELQATVDAALADAAKRTGIERARLKVVSAQAVTWPDGSLGCPSPGRSYTQALTPGFRIVIQAGKSTLDYHTNTRLHLVLCSGRGTPPPSHI
jgi:hypothetical protein